MLTPSIDPGRSRRVYRRRLFPVPRSCSVAPPALRVAGSSTWRRDWLAAAAPARGPVGNEPDWWPAASAGHTLRVMDSHGIGPSSSLCRPSLPSVLLVRPVAAASLPLLHRIRGRSCFGHDGWSRSLRAHISSTRVYHASSASGFPALRWHERAPAARTTSPGNVVLGTRGQPASASSNGGRHYPASPFIVPFTSDAPLSESCRAEPLVAPRCREGQRAPGPAGLARTVRGTADFPVPERDGTVATLWCRAPRHPSTRHDIVCEAHRCGEVSRRRGPRAALPHPGSAILDIAVCPERIRLVHVPSKRARTSADEASPDGGQLGRTARHQVATQPDVCSAESAGTRRSIGGKHPGEPCPARVHGAGCARFGPLGRARAATSANIPLVEGQGRWYRCAAPWSSRLVAKVSPHLSV